MGYELETWPRSRREGEEPGEYWPVGTVPAEDSPYRPARISVPTAVLIVLLGCGMVAGLLLPGVTRIRVTSHHSRCGGNLRQLGLACRLYADENGACFPDSLDRLEPGYVPGPGESLCPGAADRTVPSYALVPGLLVSMPADTILLHDSSVQNHRGAGRNVARVDGRVEWLEEAEFARRLAEQCARLAGEGESQAGPEAAP